MKNVLKTAIVTLALTAGAALTQAAHVEVVNVPFDFVANGVEMPAGKYTVENDYNFVRIIGAKGLTSAMLPYGGVSVKKESKTRLVLKKQNGKMHVVGVRDQSSDVVRSVSSGS